MDATTMPAGREMDAEIARLVFGYELKRCGVYDSPDDGRACVCAFCEFPDNELSCPGDRFDHREDWCYVEGNGLDVVPAYSTDVAAAFTVIEKLKRTEYQGWGDTVMAWGNFGDDPTPRAGAQMCYPAKLSWRVRIDDEKTGRGAEAYADTLPLAICRAALDAVGGG